MTTVKLTEEVKGILETAAVWDDEGLTLGSALSRSEYQAVNKFLELSGAKWDRKSKRHLFQPGGREKLESLLEDGEIRDDKKHFQAFYTPRALALELAEIADIKPHMTCLEPSAGHGAICEAIREVQPLASIGAIDINPDVLPVLNSKGFFGLTADFLECRPESFSRKFDRVLMNPPFTKDQDIKHVRHAFDFLREGGRLVALMSPGFTFGESKIRREFRDFLEEHGRVVREVEAGAFKESGTDVRTVVELVK